MTNQEIFLLLLEKTKEYEYGYIRVYSNGWRMLSEIDIKNQV